MFRARGRPSVRSAPVWTDTRGQRESATQLGGPSSRPRRTAAPLSPKALSHEETPYPPLRHTPLHEAPRSRARDPRPARDLRARVGRERRVPRTGRGCARTVSCRGADRGPAQPRPGGRRAALTSGNAMGLAWPSGTDGPAGRRLAGAARDAQTRGHYFCSEPRTAPQPGPLIKPRGAAPSLPRRPDAKHLCRPRPGPRPFQQARRRAPPPTRSQAPERRRARRLHPLRATAYTTPPPRRPGAQVEHATHIVILVKS